MLANGPIFVVMTKVKKYFAALISGRFLHFSEPQKWDSYATVLSCFS